MAKSKLLKLIYFNTNSNCSACYLKYEKDTAPVWKSVYDMFSQVFPLFLPKGLKLILHTSFGSQ